MHCWWCQNPETRPEESEQAREMDVAELSRELERDERYWRASGGGVTLSGGEPLLQAEGVAALLEELGSRGHHRVIDTSGAVEPEAVRMVLPHAELWLWDLKAVDEERFRKGTGGCARLPIENLEMALRETATPISVRIPLIRGFNDDDEAERIVRWLSQLQRPVEVQVLQGHDLSKSKRACSPNSHSAAADPSRVREIRKAAREAGLAVVDSEGKGDR